MTSITPPTTKIEVISQAAVLCGRQSFNTLDAGGAFAQDGDALFNTLVCAEIGSNRWRFSQTSLEIASLTTLTPNFDGWLYYFELPADCLMLTSLDPMIDYLVYGRRVLTRTDNAVTAKYTQSVPVSLWPPAFSFYIVYHLASLMAISVTNSDRMVARIESGMQEWRSRALYSDGQNSRPQRIRSNPWVDVRYEYRTRRR